MFGKIHKGDARAATKKGANQQGDNVRNKTECAAGLTSIHPDLREPPKMKKTERPNRRFAEDRRERVTTRYSKWHKDDVSAEENLEKYI